jgi:hypothetical protein
MRAATMRGTRWLLSPITRMPTLTRVVTSSPAGARQHRNDQQEGVQPEADPGAGHGEQPVHHQADQVQQMQYGLLIGRAVKDHLAANRLPGTHR